MPVLFHSLFQDVLSAMSNGILDSLRGFVLIFTLDHKIELQRSHKRESKNKQTNRRVPSNTEDSSKEKQE